MRRALLLSLLVLLAGAACGGSDEAEPTLAQLEKELICPTCQTTLELSNAPVADQMRAFIRERIAAGDSESEIKDALVAQFGEAVLAAPPRSGFNLLAWVLPLAGGALAVAGLADHMLRYLAVMALAASGLIVLSVLHRARGLAIRDGWRLPGLAAWTLGFLLGLPLEAAGSPLALPIALLATGITDLLLSSARCTLSGSETDMGDE